MAKYDMVKMQKRAAVIAEDFWIAAKSIFDVDTGQLPIVIMNARLTATAGRAWLEENKIDLSCYLMDKYPEEFDKVTIPHELCHHIAFRLYGDKGHGRAWKFVMAKMGLDPAIYHNMETLYRANQRSK